MTSFFTPDLVDTSCKMKFKFFCSSPHILRSSSPLDHYHVLLVSLPPLLSSSKPRSTQWPRGFLQKITGNHSSEDCSVTSHHVHRDVNANVSPFWFLEDGVDRNPRWWPRPLIPMFGRLRREERPERKRTQYLTLTGLFQKFLNSLTTFGETNGIVF